VRRKIDGADRLAGAVENRTLRRHNLSPRTENPIVPVRFPHSSSDIEQTVADTKKTVE
jgi:hypothetical protein